MTGENMDKQNRGQRRGVFMSPEKNIKTQY